jgi:hypothetical protein
VCGCGRWRVVCVERVVSCVCGVLYDVCVCVCVCRGVGHVTARSNSKSRRRVWCRSVCLAPADVLQLATTASATSRHAGACCCCCSRCLGCCHHSCHMTSKRCVVGCVTRASAAHLAERALAHQVQHHIVLQPCRLHGCAQDLGVCSSGCTAAQLLQPHACCRCTCMAGMCAAQKLPPLQHRRVRRHRTAAAVLPRDQAAATASA